MRGRKAACAGQQVVEHLGHLGLVRVGRIHHSVGMGSNTETATSAHRNSSLRPHTKAPLAMTLTLAPTQHPVAMPDSPERVAPPANSSMYRLLGTADIRSLAWSDLECWLQLPARTAA